MSEWQPVRIAPYNKAEEEAHGVATDMDGRLKSVGIIVRVRRVGCFDGGEPSFLIHPDDVTLLHGDYNSGWLCEHQFQAD